MTLAVVETVLRKVAQAYRNGTFVFCDHDRVFLERKREGLSYNCTGYVMWRTRGEKSPDLVIGVRGMKYSEHRYGERTIFWVPGVECGPLPGHFFDCDDVSDRLNSADRIRYLSTFYAPLKINEELLPDTYESSKRAADAMLDEEQAHYPVFVG